MSALQNKINFVAFVAVTGANPNGDPLTGNMPRMDRRGYGEISQECIKRKLRNRLQDMGEAISVVSNDRATDGITSIQDRVEAAVGKAGKDADVYAQAICDHFIDVRAFGGTFAWKGKSSGEGLSIGIRGPVTIWTAKSVDPVIVDSMQITKSTNGTASEKRGSDTMGMRHFVEFGLYRINGSISADMASRTGLSVDDVEKLQSALCSLFENDGSAARPVGTIEVVKAYWFERPANMTTCNDAVIFRSVRAERVNSNDDPMSVDDYQFVVETPAGVTMTELDVN